MLMYLIFSRSRNSFIFPTGITRSFLCCCLRQRNPQSVRIKGEATSHQSISPAPEVSKFETRISKLEANSKFELKNLFRFSQQRRFESLGLKTKRRYR